MSADCNTDEMKRNEAIMILQIRTKRIVVMIIKRAGALEDDESGFEDREDDSEESI